jgi:hypothetical protein
MQFTVPQRRKQEMAPVSAILVNTLPLLDQCLEDIHHLYSQLLPIGVAVNRL